MAMAYVIWPQSSWASSHGGLLGWSIAQPTGRRWNVPQNAPKSDAWRPAPDNRDKHVWNRVQYNDLADCIPEDVDQLRRGVRRSFARNALRKVCSPCSSGMPTRRRESPQLGVYLRVSGR